MILQRYNNNLEIKVFFYNIACYVVHSQHNYPNHEKIQAYLY